MCGLSRAAHEEKLLVVALDVTGDGNDRNDDSGNDRDKPVVLEVAEDIMRIIPYHYMRPAPGLAYGRLSQASAAKTGHASKRLRDDGGDEWSIDDGSGSDSDGEEEEEEEVSGPLPRVSAGGLGAASSAAGGDLRPTSSVQWEQHTRGIGSRLLAKMGFIE